MNANPLRYIVQENSPKEYIIVDTIELDDYYHLGNDLDDIQALCEKLNSYNKLIKDLTGNNTDIVELLGLMTDNNLTWKGVTNIIKEALPWNDT